MPFTLAHGAAVLPFRRLRLVPSALLIGTFAPDFEYFVRLDADDRFGHTLLGTFVLTLPLALLVLWLFHNFVKLPLARLLPDSIQRRLSNHLDQFRFRGTARFALIAGSVLLGIATHLAWDSFTHANTWLYYHWAILGEPLRLPFVGRMPTYKVFQHASTIIGIGALSIWFVRWYRTSKACNQAFRGAASSTRKITIGVIVTAAAFMGGIVRAIAGTGLPNNHLPGKRFVGQLVVTAIALAWWQLVAYGFLSSRKQPAVPAPENVGSSATATLKS